MTGNIPAAEETYERALAWLRENDIDPANIIGRSRPSLVDGRLTAEIFVRNAEGKIQIDPGNNEVMRETKTFPAPIAPPPDVAEWLRPRCSECGR